VRKNPTFHPFSGRIASFYPKKPFFTPQISPFKKPFFTLPKHGFLKTAEKTAEKSAI
jgi:hypothetical protein